LLVAAGTPEEVCKVEESYTGQFLQKYLKDERNYERSGRSGGGGRSRSGGVKDSQENLAGLAESTNL
jgi:hypothetical protein